MSFKSLLSPLFLCVSFYEVLYPLLSLMFSFKHPNRNITHQGFPLLGKRDHLSHGHNFTLISTLFLSGQGSSSPKCSLANSEICKGKTYFSALTLGSLKSAHPSKIFQLYPVTPLPHFSTSLFYHPAF